MNGAENIIKKIIDEAHLQAANNIKEAEKQAENIIKAATDEALQQQNNILEKTKKEISEKRKRFVAVAELDARKIRLKAKQDLISEVFSLAHKKINSLPPNEYRDILTGMILSLSPQGNEEIIVSEEDKNKLGDDFIKKINTKLIEQNVAGNIKYSNENREMGGGFILKSGNIETNNSFNSIFRMRYNELEAEVIRVLFS